MATLPKPQLRHLTTGNFKMDLVKMTIVSISAALAFKYLYAEPKKRKYAEFYKTYDREKSLQKMIDAGYMHADGGPKKDPY